MTNQTSMNSILRRPVAIAAIAVILLIALAVLWPGTAGVELKGLKTLGHQTRSMKH